MKQIYIVLVVALICIQVARAKICGLTAACVLHPELTEGPYYGKAGIQFRLQVTVLNVSSCQTIPNAIVDIWHCDSSGIYSHYEAASKGQGSATDNTTYIRGQYATNSAGVVEFQSIYPGWYQGRATHIHLKVHVGGNVLHTGQLFLNDTLTDKIAKIAPYSSRTITRTLNSQDNIYSGGGVYGLLTTSLLGSTESEGILAYITVGVSADGTTTTTNGPGVNAGLNIAPNILATIVVILAAVLLT